MVYLLHFRGNVLYPNKALCFIITVLLFLLNIILCDRTNICLDKAASREQKILHEKSCIFARPGEENKRKIAKDGGTVQR